MTSPRALHLATIARWVQRASLETAHGADHLVAALERAVAFGRFRAHDVRSILAAGVGVAQPTRSGEARMIGLPTVATRPLSAYAISDPS